MVTVVEVDGLGGFEQETGVIEEIVIVGNRGGMGKKKGCSMVGSRRTCEEPVERSSTLFVRNASPCDTDYEITSQTDICGWLTYDHRRLVAHTEILCHSIRHGDKRLRTRTNMLPLQ